MTTTTLESTEIDAPASPPPEVDAAEPTTEPPAPRQPSLLDLLAQAEAALPDRLDIARVDLAGIVDRADCLSLADVLRAHALADELRIDRKVLRAGLEAVAALRAQVRKEQATLAELEQRQIVLAADVEQLEANHAALQLERSTEEMLDVVDSCLVGMLRRAAPGLERGWVKARGWAVDRFGASNGNAPCLSVETAARKERLQIVQGDFCRRRIADLTQQSISRGGASSECRVDVDRLTEREI